MKVYDFDKTIYNGDSTAHFYFYCLSRRPKMLIHLPATALAGIRYRFGAISKTQFKQTLYRFLTCIGNTEEMVENFWKGHKKNLKRWYLDSKEPTDVIISASPYFLLKDICAQLGVECLMASNVDSATGIYDGENCHGKEKVRRFYEKYPDGRIDEFYSDSRSDDPLAQISAKAFLVKGNKIEKW